MCTTYYISVSKEEFSYKLGRCAHIKTKVLGIFCSLSHSCWLSDTVCYIPILEVKRQ